MRNGIATLAVLALAGMPAIAGDPPAGGAAPSSPYAAALARVHTLEDQLVGTVDTIVASSVTVLISKIPPAPKGGPPPAREPRMAGVGSGEIIRRASKTWILTNHHVIDDADKIEIVTRDGVTRTAQIVDVVKEYDIALLQFTNLAKDDKLAGVKPVEIRGKASQDLEEGQWCIATGSPFFLAVDGVPVVTLGVISGKDRVLGSGHVYGRAIQHDAAVNPGNSGGPLWNVRGEFIGINGMIQTHDLIKGQAPSNTGASFSIPVEQIEAFIDRLVDAKKDARAGYLGVAVETETDRAGKAVGARIVGVDTRSPAAGPKGLRTQDVIESLSVNGRSYPVRTATDLTNALAVCPVGVRVSISYRRQGSARTWAGELTAPQ